jgi:Fic family protein
MDIGNFRDNSPGRIVPLSGMGQLSHAFIPDDLPPNWQWPNKLWPKLVEARTALASLDGTAKHIPNPQLLLRPLQSREAQKSSKLEGTITEPEHQLIFDLDPKYPDSDDDPINSYREVFNYNRALRLRYESHARLPLSLRLIKELHSVLLDGVRGKNKEPGKFRTLQNQIDDPPRFVPPPPEHLMWCLDNFEKYLHSDTNYDPLVKAFLVHYQFEAIHPFRDGNGRIGRLLLAITVSEWCELSNQWLYMSPYFDKYKDKYIDYLSNVSTRGDWTTWIDFCLDGVIAQSKDAEKRCDALLDVWKQFKDKAKSIGGSYRLSTIVDELFVSPVVRISQVEKRFDITYPTAKSDLEKLVSERILVEIENSSPRTFICPTIANITFRE